MKEKTAYEIYTDVHTNGCDENEVWIPKSELRVQAEEIFKAIEKNGFLRVER